MRRPIVIAILLCAAASTAAAFAASRAPRFDATVDNPYFPLRPGTTYVYRGVRDGKSARDVVTVTRRRTTIDGAPCVVVEDRLFLDGRLAERTTDWYTQDERGDVWYFGERTATLDRRGRVTSRDGSWRAGRDGAAAGIFMPAAPVAGRSGRQEYFKGHAEDHFRVLSLRARVTAPAVGTRTALLTEEWTPLEPGAVDHKLYVKGIGTVLEEAVLGGSERLALVSFTRS